MNASLENLGHSARSRSPLAHTRAALVRGHITVGFLGGSITDGRGGVRWPEAFAAWLGGAHPRVRVTLENAAIGATGSDLAAFRAERDILARGCDLVFVEFSVNDADQPAALRGRTREGLLRQLLAAPCDVVVVHTFRPEMLAEMEAGQVPATISEFEKLAGHYGLNSVWMGLHALREVRRGLMKWEEWLPDNLHPEHRGSLSYAQSVIAFFQTSLAAPAKTRRRARRLPPPLVAAVWERVAFVPFAEVALTGPWTIRRWGQLYGWVGRVLHTTAPGASLRCRFEGRGLLLGFDFGRTSGEVRHRVDGGAWQTTQRERPAWAGNSGWFRTLLIADNLPPGPHVFELETFYSASDGGHGTTTTIAFLGEIR